MKGKLTDFFRSALPPKAAIGRHSQDPGTPGKSPVLTVRRYSRGGGGEELFLRMVVYLKKGGWLDWEVNQGWVGGPLVELRELRKRLTG